MQKLFISVWFLINYAIAYKLSKNYTKSATEQQTLLSKIKRSRLVSNNENNFHLHKHRDIKQNIKNKLLSSASEFSPTLDRYLNAINQMEEEELTKMLVDDKMADDSLILTENELKNTLPAVAWYLRQHKFYDFDHRFYSQPPDNSPSFVANFPRPGLAHVDKAVEGNCSRGFAACLRLVYTKASQSAFFSHSSRDIAEMVRLHDRTLLHAGFSSHIRQFIFRTSAAYYMCWFTLHEVPELRHLGVACHSAFHPDDTSLGRDYRAGDSLPYGCALLSFCPDPCYGRYKMDGSHPGVCPSEKECKSSSLNPCHGVGDGTCTIDGKRNRDFRSLMRNKINITCPCDSVRTGFRWSNEFSTCVDREECLEESVPCQTESQVCRNTVGSYWCACRLAYVYSASVQGCVRDNSASVRLLPLHHTSDVTTSPPTLFFNLEKFVSVVEELFYLNSCHCKNISSASLTILLAVHLFLLTCVWH